MNKFNMYYVDNMYNYNFNLLTSLLVVYCSYKAFLRNDNHVIFLLVSGKTVFISSFDMKSNWINKKTKDFCNNLNFFQFLKTEP